MNRIGGTYYNPNEKTNSTKREVKTVKLNYEIDKPTINGRIYKREDVKKAFDDIMNRVEIPVVRNSDELYKIDEYGVIYDTSVLFKDIIGFFKGYEIKENGEIYIKVEPIFNTGLFDGCHYFSTAVVGRMREDNSVDIDAIVGFFICGDKDIINVGGPDI